MLCNIAISTCVEPCCHYGRAKCQNIYIVVDLILSHPHITLLSSIVSHSSIIQVRQCPILVLLVCFVTQLCIEMNNFFIFVWVYYPDNSA